MRLGWHRIICLHSANLAFPADIKHPCMHKNFDQVQNPPDTANVEYGAMGTTILHAVYKIAV